MTSSGSEWSFQSDEEMDVAHLDEPTGELLTPTHSHTHTLTPSHLRSEWSDEEMDVAHLDEPTGELLKAVAQVQTINP